METPTILIVDDEEALRDALTFSLEREHYRVVTASTGPEGLDRALQERPHLVVLDVMLPGLDGLEVCRELRARGYAGTVLLLTARDQEVDRVVGLEIGADDYVTKPFSTRELTARIKAHLRRERRRETPAGSDLAILPERREVWRQGQRLALTPRETDLVLYLAENRGRAVSREALVSRVWGYDFDGDDRVVKVTVQRLRDKLEPDPRNPRYLVTVRGFGYMLEADG